MDVSPFHLILSYDIFFFDQLELRLPIRSPLSNFFFLTGGPLSSVHAQMEFQILPLPNVLGVFLIVGPSQVGGL